MLAETIRSFLRDDGGATAIEYALLGTLIAMALLGTFAVLGDGLPRLFNNGASDVLADQTTKIN